MKAAILTSYGDAPIEVADISIPQPGAGKVLIHIRAPSLDPFELMLRAGHMAAYIPLQLPAVLGSDAAGVVEKVGAGVTDFAVGDRVIADFAPDGHGAQAHYGIAPV